MGRTRVVSCVALALVSGVGMALGLSLAFRGDSATEEPAALESVSSTEEAGTNWLQLPLAFEANLGQVDSEVRFLSRVGGGQLYLTSSEAVFVLEQPRERRPEGRFAKGMMGHGERLGPPGERSVLRMRLEGANPAPDVAGLEPLPGRANYFIGNDPSRWRTDVPTYRQVEYTNAWEAIDTVFYGNPQRLEYDFVVRPGGDPADIRLAFEGADELTVDDAGNLLVSVDALEVVHRAPVVYQERDGTRTELNGRYVLLDDHRVGFWVADYDPRRSLRIDPVVEWGTYLGGSGFDAGSGVDVDAEGAVYATGQTDSLDYPIHDGASQGTYPGGGGSVFITKIDPTGTMLVYSTYLGGSGADWGGYLKVDETGRAWVVGDTSSPDYPTTANAFDPTYNGDGDAHLAVLSADGNALEYATYFGGSGYEFFRNHGIRKDPKSGRVLAYAEGGTYSPDLPIRNAYQDELAGGWDGFIAVLDPFAGAPQKQLIYSTYIGGSVWDIAHGTGVSEDGLMYVTGRDQSVAKQEEIHWHLDTYDGRGVMWCGERSPDGWVGYANGWIQALTKEFTLPTGSADLGFSVLYNVEWGYDYLFVSLSEDGGGTWDDLAVFNGISAGFEEHHLDLSAYAGTTVLIRFVGYSDAGWSDQDGLWTTGGDGLAHLDWVEVTGTPRDDFESDDGGWVATDEGIPEILFPADYRYGPQGGIEDAFVLIIDPTKVGARSLVASATIGGTAFENGLEIRPGPGGYVYATGISGSDDFPTTPGAFLETNPGGSNVWIAKFAPDLSSLEYATLLGGSRGDIPMGIVVDPQGRVAVTGQTTSPDFPTVNAFQKNPSGTLVSHGYTDWFVSQLTPDGSALVWSSYAGGEGSDNWGPMAGDTLGNLYVLGYTDSHSLPGAGQGYDNTLAGPMDAYLLKIAPE